jgi:membrane-bound lytic murein transglycosylase D
MLSLTSLARLAGTKPDVLRSLNPELRRGRVPPSRDRYQLRIPLGAYPRFVWNYADLPDRQKQPASTYTVRAGDTLSEIAERFGTSTGVLQRLNDLNGTLIRQGQRLVIPVRDYEGALTTEAQENQPMRVQYGTSPPVRPLDPIDTATSSQTAAADGSAESSQTLASTGSAGSASTSSDEVSSVYRVQRGDTLGGIAQRFGVSVQQLRSWNNLNGSRIYPGQRLQIAD